VRATLARLVPPRPLAALLAATAILGVAWILVVPPFQAPDENAHIAYVQSLAERGALPGDANRQGRSTEQELGSVAANSDQTAQVLLTKPTWSDDAYRRWQRRSDSLPSSARSDGGGPNFASSNPPLYYVWSVVPYSLASGGDLFARITAVRLGSVLFLLVTVTATWLLAGAVFGPRRELQLAAAAVPALLPMMSFISSSASPDSLTYALWSLALWLGARILLGHGRALDIAALIGVTGLAMATKATSYALIPAVLFVLGVALWRVRHRTKLVASIAVAGLVMFALTAGAWYVVAGSSGRPAASQVSDALHLPATFDAKEFASYTWQFYLPRLPFQTRYAGIDWPPPVYDLWTKQSIGAFGWLEIQWPQSVYRLVTLLLVCMAAAALVALVRRRKRIDRPLALFFVLAALALLFGLHWNEYKLAEVGGALVNQGRYLFPLIALAGLVPATALTLLQPRARMLALGAFVGLLAVFELFSIALVAGRFYA
jgi:4-amino-4-deoxy-L-arabinose transferase-like glycosyltransferase